MKPSDIGAAIRKRAWLVILLVLVTTLVAAIVGYVQSPKYKAQITMIAIAPVDEVTGQPNPTVQAGYLYFIASIAGATESLDVASAVRESLLLQGIDIPPEELVKKASATNPANSTSIEITFTDNSPTRVADIANTWGAVLEQKTSDDYDINDAEFKRLLFQGKLVLTNKALPPESPTQPKPLLYVGLGAFLGLLIGLILAIVIEYLNPYFRNVPEVEENLGLPVYGTIPKIKSGEETSLLSDLPDTSYAHEAYAQLRTTLMFSLREDPSKTMAVIPAIPTESIPYVPANLAISMAQGGRRTLLIDCDLKERGTSVIMGAQGKPGLSDALASGDSLTAKILATKVPRLSFLPAGKPKENPSDLLSLPSFDQHLRELEREYDKVIFSTPSLLLSIDPVIVASKTHMSLMVVDAGKCSRNAALTSLESFNLLHLKPTGIILSGVKLSRRERAARAHLASTEHAMDKKAAAAAGTTFTYKTKIKEEAAEANEAPRVEPPAAPPEAKPEAKPLAQETPSPPREAVAKEEEEAMPVGTEPHVTTGDLERKIETYLDQPSPPSREAVAKEEAAAAPREAPRVESPAAPPEAKRDAYPAAPGKVYDDISGISPASIPQKQTEEELGQLKETLADDFRRLGATGAPIPKDWLKALRADKTEVQEAANIAIKAYYASFLRRYGISEENVKKITISIMSMMRREGRFASMNEKEAQQYLQKMLVDAGAKFSAGSSPQRQAKATPRTPVSSSYAVKKAAPGSKQKRKMLSRQDKKTKRASRSRGKKGDSRRSQARKQTEEGNDIEWE